MPKGGKYDEIFFDPDNRFVKVLENPKTYACSWCGKVYPKQQGMAAHSKYCKEKNNGQ